MNYFWENFLALCCQFNKTPTAVTRELGISKSLITHWKKGGIPHQITAKKIADYFGVTVEYFSNPQKSLNKRIRLDRLGSLCIEQKTSFSSLSKKLGIDPFVFSGEQNILSGEYAPLIAKILKTTVEYLTGDSDEKNPNVNDCEVVEVSVSPQEANYILEFRTNPDFKRRVENAYEGGVPQNTIADDIHQTVSSAASSPIKKK